MERHYTDGTEPDILPHYSRANETGESEEGEELSERPARLLGQACLIVALCAIIVLILVSL